MLHKLSGIYRPVASLLRLVVITVLIGLSGTAFAASGGTPVVILNNAVPDNQLTRSALRAIFTMRLKRWSDGTPVRVFVLPDDHPLHQSFSKSTLAVFPYQLRQIWDRSVFSGTGTAPTQVESEEQLIDAITQVPGAVGYVADGNRKDGVQYVIVK